MGAALRKQADNRLRIALELLPRYVGQELGVSDWLLIDQERVNRFADATGDHQWIHVDVERARAEIGEPIAHGYLTLSLIPMLTSQIAEITGVARTVNYGCNRVRFTKMVRVGRHVRLRWKVVSCERRAGGYHFVTQCVIEVEGETRPACTAEMVTMLYGD
jgi:acyl dehydratase